MGLLLYIVSFLLAALLFPIGIVYALVYCFYKHHIGAALQSANKKFMVLATAFDKYGNVVCAELFNATLLDKYSVHPFGHIEETISQVIGHNLVNGTLSRTGRMVNAALNFFQKDHALKSIQRPEL